MNITKSPSLQLLRKLHYQFSGLNDVSISSEDDWDSVTTVVHRNSGWFSARTSRCSSIMSLTLDWEESKKERELALRNALKCDTLEEPNFKFGLNALLASDTLQKDPQPGLKSPGSQLDSPLSPSLDYRVSVGALLSAGCEQMGETLKTEREAEKQLKIFDAANESLKPAEANVETSSRGSTKSPGLDDVKPESPVREHVKSPNIEDTKLTSPSAECSRSPMFSEPKLPVLKRVRSPHHLESRLSESDASEDVSSSAASALSDTKTSSDERAGSSSQDQRLGKRIFVGNFSPNTTRNMLFKFFSNFAKVSDVYLVKDYKTRKSRRQAFVQFTTVDDAKRVLAMDPSEMFFNGRTLFVDAARPKQTRVSPSSVSIVPNAERPPSPAPLPASTPLTDAAETATINSLPREILQKIFGFLSIRERVATEQVCKYWRYLGVEAGWDVKHLSLEGTATFYKPITEYMLRSILKRCGSTLVSLNMNGCGRSLSYRSVEMIAQYCHHLEVVDLSTLPVTTTGLKILSTACVKIRKATLKNCNFGEKGLWWLLKNCHDLEFLDISENDRIKGLCFHIINKEVKSLILQNCCKIAPQGFFELRRCTSIQDLVLNNCLLLDTAAFQFILSEFASTLKTLHLDGYFCRIDFQHISCKTMPNIADISFMNNKSIDDLVLEMIAKNCPNVRKANLSGTVVTNFGLQHLARLQHLHELNISHLKEVTGVGIEMLATAGRLQSLTIRGSEHLTDNVCVDLVMHCKDLSHLDISSCRQVSDEAVAKWMTIIDVEERPSLLKVIAGGTQVASFVAMPSLSVVDANLCPVYLRPFDPNSDVYDEPECWQDEADGDDDELDPHDDEPEDEFDARLADYEMRS